MLTISNVNADNPYIMPDTEYLSNSLSGSVNDYKSSCKNNVSFTWELYSTNADELSTINPILSSKMTNCANAIARKVVMLNDEAVKVNNLYYDSLLKDYLSTSLNTRKQKFIDTIGSDNILSTSFSGDYSNYKLRFKILFGKDKNNFQKFNIASSWAITNLKNAISAFTDTKFNLVNSGGVLDDAKVNVTNESIDNTLASYKGNVIDKINVLFSTASGSYDSSYNEKMNAYQSAMINIFNVNLESEINEVKNLIAFKKKSYDFRTKINNNAKIALAYELSKLNFGDDNIFSVFKAYLQNGITWIKRINTPLLEQWFYTAFFQNAISDITTRKNSISAFINNVPRVSCHNCALIYL